MKDFLAEAAREQLKKNLHAQAAWMFFFRQGAFRDFGKFDSLAEVWRSCIGKEGSAKSRQVMYRLLLEGEESSGALLALSDQALGVGQAEAALGFLGQIEASGPGVWRYYVYLATVHTLLDDLEQAEAAMDRVRELADPKEYGPFTCFLSTLVHDMEKARELAPPNTLRAAEIAFLTGRYEEAWGHYSCRLLDTEYSAPTCFPEELWDGASRGKSIFVRVEQGLGDSVHFWRYLPKLREYFERVVLEVDWPNFRLALSLEGVDLVVIRGSAQAASIHTEKWVPILELGRHFQVKPGFQEPYITPPSSFLELECRTERPSLKVGLVWAGSAQHARNRERSLCLNAFGCLAEVPNVQFFALQTGGAALEANWPPQNMADRIKSLEPWLLDLGDLAFALSNLDLLISVDTAPIHVAGALGVPTFALIHHLPDWRWGLGSEKTPWYPSLTLFRQPERGDWQGALANVKLALQERVLSLGFDEV